MANKGSGFEREISRNLSLWISDGTDDSWVWRTSQSGGRATTRAKKGDKTSGGYGDLTNTDDRAGWFFSIFSLELKNGYERADISSIIDSRQSNPLILQFWEQCERDRTLRGSMFGMLILKRDRRHTLTIMPECAFLKLLGIFGNYPYSNIRVSNKSLKLVCVRFYDLFEWMSPEPLKMWKESN